MSEDLKLVYTGSRVEGMFLAELLEENEIGVIYRDNEFLNSFILSESCSFELIII